MEQHWGELYHHGVKGMKWGVRRNRDRISGLQRRIDNHQAKAAKGDKNFLYRNTIGDFRRGQAHRLKNVKAHREAKAAYKENKTSENKKALRSARANRVVYNTVTKPIIGVGGGGGRGAYHRYRDSGNDIAMAGLKAFGKRAVVGLVGGVAIGYGRRAAEHYMAKKIYY